MIVNILSIANKIIRLDISETHNVLVCEEATSSLTEKIQAHQLEDPQLSDSGNCS